MTVKKEKESFEKQANSWLEEQYLSVQEDEYHIEHIDKVINNLKLQKTAGKGSMKLRFERCREYIKTLKKSGYVINDKYIHWLKIKK